MFKKIRLIDHSYSKLTVFFMLCNLIFSINAIFLLIVSYEEHFILILILYISFIYFVFEFKLQFNIYLRRPLPIKVRVHEEYYHQVMEYCITNNIRTNYSPKYKETEFTFKKPTSEVNFIKLRWGI